MISKDVCDCVNCTVKNYFNICPVSLLILILSDAQVEKMDSECSRLQQELQDSKDQNELLEFRILELEVSHNEFPTKPLLN